MIHRSILQGHHRQTLLSGQLLGELSPSREQRHRDLVVRLQARQGLLRHGRHLSQQLAHAARDVEQQQNLQWFGFLAKILDMPFDSLLFQDEV
ncbi:MAG: hypothetical protein QM757_24090 [Paludibaculum sp.]